MPTISSRRSSTRSGSSRGSFIGSSPGIDGESARQLANAAADALFYLSIALITVLRKPFDDFRDQATDFPELGGAEPPGRARWSAEADARGDERASRIERDRVLV